MTETTNEATPSGKPRPWWEGSSIPTPVLDMNADSSEGYDAYHEAVIVRDILRLRRPAADSLLAAFNLAAPEWERNDDYLPSLVGIDAAFRLIDDMPPEERRELLGGWDRRPRFHRFSREDVLDVSRENDTLYVALRVGCPDHTYKGTSGVECVFSNMPHPTQVLIQFGTHKQSAIDSLLKAIAKIESEWDTMVAELPADVRVPQGYP